MKNLLTILMYLLPLTSFAVTNSKLDLYTDCLGRTTLEPSNYKECIQRRYDSNNALLWTGELALLLKEYHGNLPTDVKEDILDFLPSHFVRKGILSRHPEPYRFQDTMRPISFDEYTGVAFMAAVIPEARKFMDETVEYGMNNYWQFWDVPKYEKGKSWFNLFTISALKEWVPYLKEESYRKSTINYPQLYPLFATHHIHQRAFYKMMSSKYKPSLFEELYFVASSLLAERKDNWSSLSMWMFRYKALDQYPYDSKMVVWAKERFRKKMDERFGSDYEVIVFSNFYEDDNHPFHDIAKALVSHKKKVSASYFGQE